MELRCSFTELHSDASPNRSSSPMTDVFCFAAMQLHGEREPELPSLFDHSGASRKPRMLRITSIHYHKIDTLLFLSIFFKFIIYDFSHGKSVGKIFVYNR